MKKEERLPTHMYNIIHKNVKHPIEDLNKTDEKWGEALYKTYIDVSVTKKYKSRKSQSVIGLKISYPDRQTYNPYENPIHDVYTYCMNSVIGVYRTTDCITWTYFPIKKAMKNENLCE